MGNEKDPPQRIKPWLEKTVEDHRAIASTPPPALVENPGKSLAEIMDESALAEYLDRGLADIKETYDAIRDGKPIGGRPVNKRWYRTLLNNFRQDVEYVQRIGRLPEKTKEILAVLKTLHLPEGK